MKVQPNNNNNPVRPRRVIALGGLAALGAAVLALNPFKFSPKKTSTVKMLGEDGKLIAVDEAILANSSKRMASDEELQQWVKK